MNKTALKALKQSIAHWTRLSTGKPRKGETPTWVYCSLCKLYLNDKKCIGCPVQFQTKKISCDGTPYQEAFYTWKKFGIDSFEFKKAAEKELGFLKSLLPKIIKSNK